MDRRDEYIAALKLACGYATTCAAHSADKRDEIPAMECAKTIRALAEALRAGHFVWGAVAHRNDGPNWLVIELPDLSGEGNSQQRGDPHSTESK